MTEKLNIKQLKPVSTDVNLGTSDALLPTQNAVKTYVDTADSGLQTQIDALSGRGRFLSVWNCVTGLPETEPETSPYEYKAGDYYIVGVVSSATPAVDYKPDGTEYVSGVASTTLETSEVSVNDTYLYDGENWVLQSNAQKEVSFSALAGSPYDNTNLGNALDAKADETNTINGAALSNSETLFYGTSATAGLTAEKKVSIPSITTLKKGVVIFVKPDMTATVAGITLKLNDFNAYPIHYNGAAISTTTDSIVWNQSYISIFVFDGTFWQFAGHGYDKDTTYSDATDIIKGIAKLYNSTGNNTDGSMTQNSITTQLATKQDTLTVGSNITISGNTISATDTTYTGSDGITLTGTNFTNSGVRSVSTGSTNGTISVNTNGTSADVAVYGLGTAAYTSSGDYATSAQGGKADTAVQPGDLATVATSGSYNDLSDKPTIPTVNNATLTIQKNGTTVQTFTANQSTNATADISVPTKTSDITNDSGFITSSALAPYALSADLATVATTGDYDDLSNKPTIPTVNNPTITITQGGVTKGSFTLNQASGDTIALDAGSGSIAWGNITGTLANQTDLQNALNTKQNTLTAGDGIDITSSIISVNNIDCGTMS